MSSSQAVRQPAAQGQAPRQQQQEGGGGGGISMRNLVIGGLFYLACNVGLSWYFKKTQVGTTITHPETGKLITVPDNLGGNYTAYQLRPKPADGAQPVAHHQPPASIVPMWPQDSTIDVVVTLSESTTPPPFARVDKSNIVLQELGFQMNNYSDKRAIDTTFKVPKSIQNNATLFGHFYVGLSNPEVPLFSAVSPENFFAVVHPLTQHIPRKKQAKARNLLEGLPDEEEQKEAEEDLSVNVLNYYHPNTTISIVPDFGIKDYRGLQPALKMFVPLEPTGARDATGKNGWYYPPVFLNTFWQLAEHMYPVNDTTPELPLHIDLGNLPTWQFTWMSTLEENAKENARKAAWGGPLPTGSDGSEIQLIKSVLLDTNPILLAVTAFATIAHLVLETLAFGSDIAHYRKKKDNVGISVRSILANVFMQTVILLYLVDNSQNTSWMIFATQAFGIVIELWKVTTVVNVVVRPTAPGSLIPYEVSFEDKHKLTETEAKTKEYDETAFKYMYMAGVPLLLAYAVYSLMYETHKSWYSFVITTLVGSVYAYGFLMMVPSLYINYRLKSVAHMPGKAMMYKFLNTFIDDLFAFTIKQPMLYRLATFRDDIIFFVYLYQTWRYKVDYTRVNEFGQGGDDEEEEADKKVEDVPTATAIEGAKASGVDTGKASKRK